VVPNVKHAVALRHLQHLVQLLEISALKHPAFG
jgi:hypothetical protein